MPLLRDWRLIVLVGTSWPFWTDIYAGNGLTFVFVAAVLALAGNRAGTWVTLALALLIPRPLILPLVVWILWRRPEWRIRFAALFVIHAALVLATGWGGEWLTVLMGSTTDEFANGFNMAPSAVIGTWWMAIGIPLAAWLTWKGRVGLAGLAVAPYWFSYYLLMGLLELADNRGSRTVRPLAALPIAVGVRLPIPVTQPRKTASSMVTRAGVGDTGKS